MLYIIEDMINGVLMGSIYGLTAMGLTIIFGVLKVINFAHGSLLMVGMYATYWAITLTGVHPYLALAMVIPAMFIFGYYLQAIVIKPIFIAEKNVREPITVIIVTTGIWYILDNLALLVFGPQYRSLADNPLKGKMLEVGGMFVSQPKLFGFITAITILCECGDITRFDNIDQLSSYAGLCPRVSQSGESAHHGHISKQGPPLLRWVLQQAAWVAIRCDPNARRIYARISKRAGNKKAATALARKLLSYAWSVCRQGRPFVWPNTEIKPGNVPGPGWSFDI